MAEFVELLDCRFELFTSRADGGLLARQTAAGGLARCRSLLGALAVLEMERPDVMGLLLRNLWEAVMVSLYVLVGGPDALTTAYGDHARHVRTIVDRNDFDELAEVIAAWPEAGDRLVIEQVAKEVWDLLRESGHEESEYASTGYDLLYRAESTFGGHGVGALTPYIDTRGDPWAVKPRPGSINVEKPASYLRLGALYTSTLAYHTFRAFGVGTADLENLSTAILNEEAEPNQG